jgi:PAS domain S-box-containing protein
MEVRPNPAKKPARLKEALERSQRDLEDFFENGVVGLHWVASDGSILRVNQAELDLLGYTREEYVGRHIAEFHADESVIDDILARLTRGEKLDKYGARLKAKDGSIKARADQFQRAFPRRPVHQHPLLHARCHRPEKSRNCAARKRSAPARDA